MQSPQELFNKIQELKKEQKEINREYKDALSNANEFEETAEKMKELREKKKQIENIIQQRLGKRWEQFENNKRQIEEMTQLITDVSMSAMMEGKTVEIKDAYDNPYEPVYKITFRKVK